MCGEKGWIAVVVFYEPGSPPRVRGKADGCAMVGDLDWITPACAGKSLCRAPQRPLYRDHPRVCGEKKSMGAGTDGKIGSPPRVRGKEGKCTHTNMKPRITPACAGKSMYRTTETPWSRDHPRVCGEKAAYLRAVWVPKGSPPRVRGKVCMATGLRISDGITPACAGKSLMARTSTSGV